MLYLAFYTTKKYIYIFFFFHQIWSGRKMTRRAKSYVTKNCRFRMTFCWRDIVFHMIFDVIANATNRGSALSSLQTICRLLFLWPSAAQCVKSVCESFTNLQVSIIYFKFSQMAQKWSLTFPLGYISGFPNGIWCIDGIQVPITAPSINEADDVNRRGEASVNVQVPIHSL